MRAGLKTRMQLPTDVASTNKRPDVVIRSSSSRKVVIVELTVPSESRMEYAYQRRVGKYQELVAAMQGREYCVSQWQLACGALLDNPCGEP